MQLPQEVNSLYLVTGEEMRKIDETAISEYNIPSIVLMENAGIKVVQAILQLHEEASSHKRITIVAGKGNNGGDGFVIARHLANKGIDIRVFVLGQLKDIKGDSGVNLQILKKMNIPILSLAEDKDLNKLKIGLLYTDLIVDAIFGTGFRGAALGLAEQAIEMINKSGVKVMAVDIPSGLEANTGKTHGACIKADYTISFAYPKLGLVMHSASEYVGQLTVVDISIPKWIPKELGIKRQLITRELIMPMMPKRVEHSHKGTYGHGLVIGGAEGMTGAVCLTGQAALTTGAGLVTIGIPASLNNIVEQKLTEVMTKPLPETQSKSLNREALEPIEELLQKASVLALGPGLSQNPETMSLVRSLLPKVQVPVVIDADGLNALVDHLEILRQIKAPVVLTPHPGEMARLLDTSVKKIQENRINTALKFAMNWGVTLVLKGSHTVVASPDGVIYLNINGNNGMSTGGSGDVLTGIIAGLICQGVPIDRASVLATYLHGDSGDKAREDKGEMALIAGDLIDCLPKALKELGG